MADTEREVVVTRAAFLELKEEQALVRDGHTLLDEKRILLAQEIRQQLARLRQLRGRSGQAEAAAREALQAALLVHGLDELTVYPPLPAGNEPVTLKRRRLLGLELIEAHLEEGPEPGPVQAANPSREAHDCALRFRAWRGVLIELAAAETNLRRLVREYTRTHRRAEALENVIMPEIDTTLKMIDEQLESQDQEEAARLRQHREHR
jgi:V/A-type H+-transporting ATPase subunit D